jgi:hypothetical protein
LKAGEASAGTGGAVEEYKAKNITTAAEAQKLAQALLKNNINGRYRYTLETETDADLGEYCTVSNTALNITTTARVVQKELDTESNIYKYELIGVDELGAITATDTPEAPTQEFDPDIINGGLDLVSSSALNEDGTIAQPVEGNKLADSDTTTAWRTYVGPYKVGTQISDVGASTWTDRAYFGGDADEKYPDIAKALGVASASADLANLDVGDELPAGAKVFQFNNVVTDLDDADPWDTETGVAYTTASRFGSHALQPATGGSTTLVDNDAQGIDMSAAFTISGWFYVAENPATDVALMDYGNGHADGILFAVYATSTGVKFEQYPDTAPAGFTNLTSTITLDMSGWFFVAVAFDGTDTWQLVVNGTAATPVTEAGAGLPYTTATRAFRLLLADLYRCDDFMILPGTELTTTQIDAHFDSGYPWATEDADGNLYLVPASGKEVVVKGAFRVGEGEHDTGWVACSSWTNQHLGDTLGGNVNHGLSKTLDQLDVKVFVSTDGTDANASELGTQVLSINAVNSYGYQTYYVDSDNIKVQTGEHGVIYIPDNGTAFVVNNESYYYRVIVRVASPAKGDTGDTGPAGPTGDTGPAGPAGEDGATSLAVAYSTGTDYIVGDAVYYDNIIWQCIQANGPSSTLVTPGTNDAYWQNYPRFFTSSSEPTGSDGADGDLWFTYTV